MSAPSNHGKGRWTFALFSHGSRREIARMSGVDGFFVPRTSDSRRTFELTGATPLTPGPVGGAELCVLDDAGTTIGSYFVGAVEVVRVDAVAGGLVDATVRGQLVSGPHPLAGQVWSRWRSGPPAEPNLWAPLDEDHRAAWMEVVAGYRWPGHPHDQPPGRTVIVDGRFTTDAVGLYLAIGEAVNGPGGYFGRNPDALADCLRGGFGATVPFTVEWTSSATAREHAGPQFDAALSVFADNQVAVRLR